MKGKRFLLCGMIIATMVMLLLLVLFPMLDSPDLKLSEEGMKHLCRQHIERFLSATNLFDTAQEAANELRYWKDPWGNCFNVIVADKFAIDSFGVAPTGELIMWSSGPNGINENGQGDDILVGDDIMISRTNGTQK